MTVLADTDPRWSLLSDQNAKCPCCGENTAGLLSIACDRPDPFPNDAPRLENAAFTAVNGDILTEDFCRMESYRFVRCVIELPLTGLDDHLVLGVWGSLRPENFDRYVDTFDAGNQAALGDMFSWLMNAVPVDLQQPTEMTMMPRDGRKRPKLFFKEETHPLYAAQQSGLSFDALAALLRGYGHDLESKNGPN